MFDSTKVSNDLRNYLDRILAQQDSRQGKRGRFTNSLDQKLQSKSSPGAKFSLLRVANSK